MKYFWLLPFLLYSSSVVAQEAFVGSSTTTTLIAMPRIPRVKEQAAIKSLLDLETKGRQEKDGDARQKIAVALARLGVTEKALAMSTNAKCREEVLQTAALRSIFVGTIANSSRWIRQIPSSGRAYAQLQLARRFVFEGHKPEAREILNQIPLPHSIKLGDLAIIKTQSDVALTAMSAGDKTASDKRFAALTAALRTLSKQNGETREQAEGDFGFVIFQRLKAGNPVTTQEILSQGRFAPMFAVSYYLDTQQEVPLRALLEALPVETSIEYVLEVASFNKKTESLRRKLLHEWMTKMPEVKREEAVEKEARSLAQIGETASAVEFIDAMLPQSRRQEAQDQLRLSILMHPEWYFRIPLSERQQWGKPLLEKLQLQRRQQRTLPDSDDQLDSTLTQIFYLAVAMGEKQVAQNALYEREKLTKGLEGEDDAQIEADLYAADWRDAGNLERAARWRKRADSLKSDETASLLERVRSLIGRGDTKQVALLLPQVTTAEWAELDDNDLYIVIAAIQSETAQITPPVWLRKLSFSQHAEALYQWAYLVAPWETMSWDTQRQH